MSKDWTGNKNSVFKPLAASNHALYSEREPNDYYATEPKAIDCLLEGGAELHKDIWEPACGEGHLSERLKSFGYNVRSTDLIDRGYGVGGVDFFCKRWGCELEYYADDITIKSRQQSLQKDIVFLFSLCKEYGFGMKAYRNKIIIFDREKQDAADPVLTVGLRNAESGDVNDNFEGLYTGAECSYKPEGSDDEQTFTYGDAERLLKLSVSATSAKEAELKCKAQLYDNNSKAVQLEFSMLGGIAPIYAGSNYIFEDLGVWNGKYAVDKVTHTLTGKKGYRINVEAHGVDILKYNPNFGKDTNGSDNSAIQEITGTAPGRAVVLKDTPLYISSDARAAVRNVTGTYYLYDGKDFGGRYRICNQDEVGATPTSANVTGYVDGSAFLGG